MPVYARKFILKLVEKRLTFCVVLMVPRRGQGIEIWLSVPLKGGYEPFRPKTYLLTYPRVMVQ